MRRACQAANLGVSLILLGLIIPIWTRNSTKKKHTEALLQAQQALSENIDNVSSLDFEKQKQFISDAGHELKTPVSIVSANAELLEREL